MADPDIPLLFLDVDGPLLPFGALSKDRPSGYAEFLAPHELPPGASPLLARINPALGPALLALGCDLVWATSWRDEANAVISPILGLGQLPTLTWPDTDWDDIDLANGFHWKTRHLVDWANGRDFIWLDDELTNRDTAWVEANHAGKSLLHLVDSSRGITTTDLDALAGWCALR